jgi:hypothetical protein
VLSKHHHGAAHAPPKLIASARNAEYIGSAPMTIVGKTTGKRLWSSDRTIYLRRKSSLVRVLH